MMKQFLMTLSALTLGASLSYADGHEGMDGVMHENADVEISFETMPDTARADILNGAGESVGEAVFTQGTIGVLAEITVNGLPPGKHGMHVHTIGACDHEGHFKSASGHVNPDEKMHGYLNPEGPDKGDLPNLIVPESGSVSVELFLPQLDVSGDDNALLDGDGSALMIHDNPDDHMTQPIGGSGPRIACGVIQ